MKPDLSKVLDESLALLEMGRATLEECVARYPEYADDLLPLLETALEVRRVPAPTPSPTAFAAGKRRMLETLAEKRRRQAASPSLFRRRVNWLTAPFSMEKSAVQRRRFAFQLAAVAALALVVLAGASLSLLFWHGEAVTQAATLAQMEGAVEVVPVGGDTWQPVPPGQEIGAGNRVRTGSFSNATLAFLDGSTVELEAETEVDVVEVSIRRDGNSRVIVLYQRLGQTYSRVKPLSDLASRFEIETPTAATAVRGTEFVVAVGPDGTTSVAVVEGLVEVVGQESAVAVQAGEQTVIQPGQPPAPVQPAPTFTPALRPTPQPPGQTRTPQPPGQTRTPQPPGQTKTPQPPGQTKTPQPPGQTKTPQPPGQTRTPQPPGQNRTPQPPGQDKPPKPPKDKPKKPG